MSENIIEIKKKLRSELIIKRDNITDIKEKSQSITDILCKQDFYINANNIMVYSSIKSEVDTSFLIDRIFFEKKTAIFPKCIRDEILPVALNSKKELEKRTYGILEPLSWDGFNKDKIDLIIVPALSYDRRKYRIGYGAGYYDRFLSGFSGMKAGFCFFEMLSDENLPTDKFDIKVDKIITNNGIY